MRYSSAPTASSYFKRLFILLIVVLALPGCATVNGVPCGVIYSNIKGPLLVTASNQAEQVGAAKIGTSSSHSIFSIITWGDASVDKALGTDVVAPGVVVSHVDFKYTQFLGCGTYKTYVYYTKKVGP